MAGFPATPATPFTFPARNGPIIRHFISEYSDCGISWLSAGLQAKKVSSIACAKMSAAPFEWIIFDTNPSQMSSLRLIVDSLRLVVSVRARRRALRQRLACIYLCQLGLLQLFVQSRNLLVLHLFPARLERRQCRPQFPEYRRSLRRWRRVRTIFDAEDSAEMLIQRGEILLLLSAW